MSRNFDGAQQEIGTDEIRRILIQLREELDGIREVIEVLLDHLGVESLEDDDDGINLAWTRQQIPFRDRVLTQERITDDL